jgi:hypothetical protein
VYAAEPDPYCYPATSVLMNLLDLGDAGALEAFEADAVLRRGDEPLPDGDFTSSHLQGIHRHLFQDVYAWAGEFRTVRISKEASMFCYPENIDSQMVLLFGWLRDRDLLRGLSTQRTECHPPISRKQRAHTDDFLRPSRTRGGPSARSGGNATRDISCRDDRRLQQRRGGIAGRNPKDGIAFKGPPP